MELLWMTSPQAREESGKDTPVIIPFGSVEQHGPHLPLGTDTLQAASVARRAAEIAGAVVAPPVHYGQCSSTRNHPGTITLAPGTLRSLAGDLIRSFSRQGFNRIILFSGHAGRIHIASLREAAEGCSEENHSLKLAVISDFDLVLEVSGDVLKTPRDGHAGEIETSRMMSLYPRAVGDPPEEEYPSFPEGRILPNPEKYWPGGVWGNPRAADPEKGGLIVERSAEALAGIIVRLTEE